MQFPILSLSTCPSCLLSNHMSICTKSSQTKDTDRKNKKKKNTNSKTNKQTNKKTEVKVTKLNQPNVKAYQIKSNQNILQAKCRKYIYKVKVVDEANMNYNNANKSGNSTVLLYNK